MKQKDEKKIESDLAKKDDFIKGFYLKSYDELMQVKQKSGGSMVLATYDYLRVCRTMELTGRYKDGNYEDFECWMDGETFSQWQNIIRV